MPRKEKHPSSNDDDYDDGYDDDYYDHDAVYDDGYNENNWEAQAAVGDLQLSGQMDSHVDVWSCSKCTFDNHQELSYCEMCANSRYDAVHHPAQVESSDKAPRSSTGKSNWYEENSLPAPKPKAPVEFVKEDLKPPPKVVKEDLKTAKHHENNGAINSSLGFNGSENVDKLKAVDLNSDKDKKKCFRSIGLPLDTYKPEDWIRETMKQENKPLLHLAIIGHVDAGKSTLMGRLLHILGQVSQKEMHKYEKDAKQMGKGSFSYAWVLDEGSEERARGITMTVAVAHFGTPKFEVVLLDSPGHKDFVPNMISGASQADAAILVVDSSTGAFEAGMEGEGNGSGQTREHTQLIRSFGVEQIIVAVNKIDSVAYSKDRFDNVKGTLRQFLRQCGFKDSGIQWIPVSAIENQNLVTSPSHSQLKEWYSGPNLLEAIDTFEAPVKNVAKPFRVAIAETLKSRSLGHAAVSGKLEAGGIKIGSKVLVMPSGLPATVKGIEQNSKAVPYAVAGDNVDIGLQGVEPSCLIQGGVLCHPDYPILTASRLEAKMLLLETSGPIVRGSQVVVHCHHAKQPAKISQLVSLMDQKGQIITNKKPRCLLPNQRAIIEITPERGMCIEEYSRFKGLGRIILRDRGKTLAVGIVTKIVDYE